MWFSSQRIVLQTSQVSECRCLTESFYWPSRMIRQNNIQLKNKTVVILRNSKRCHHNFTAWKTHINRHQNYWSQHSCGTCSNLSSLQMWIPHTQSIITHIFLWTDHAPCRVESKLKEYPLDIIRFYILGLILNWSYKLTQSNNIPFHDLTKTPAWHNTAEQYCTERKGQIMLCFISMVVSLSLELLWLLISLRSPVGVAVVTKCSCCDLHMRPLECARDLFKSLKCLW